MKFDRKKMKSQTEILELLRIIDTPTNRQRLTYCRCGRRQLQRKSSGRTYHYKLKPKLVYKLDWIYHRSRVYYTESGISKLDLYFNKKKLENISKEQ